MVSLFYVQALKTAKGELDIPRITEDLNHAFDVQKTGKCFVMVILEGLTLANEQKWMAKIPVLKSLNLVSDKECVIKERAINT